jgi:hypothetical protein
MQVAAVAVLMLAEPLVQAVLVVAVLVAQRLLWEQQGQLILAEVVVVAVTTIQ